MAGVLVQDEPMILRDDHRSVETHTLRHEVRSFVVAFQKIRPMSMQKPLVVRAISQRWYSYLVG